MYTSCASEEGSTILVQRVDPQSVPKVRARVNAIDVTNEEGPEDALCAFKALNHRLAEDNTVGRLYQDDGAEILYFPGCERATRHLPSGSPTSREPLMVLVR